MLFWDIIAKIMMPILAVVLAKDQQRIKVIAQHAKLLSCWMILVARGHYKEDWLLAGLRKSKQLRPRRPFRPHLVLSGCICNLVACKIINMSMRNVNHEHHHHLVHLHRLGFNIQIFIL